MKTHLRGLMVILVVLLTFSQLFGQSRRGQFEIYAGANFPLAPDDFKDFYKTGFSLNAQYVFFPSMRVGIPIFAGYEYFSVDNDAINKEFRSLLEVELSFLGLQLVNSNLDVSGSASLIRLGAGVRPYLTPPEASTQFFLFGNATFNLIKTKDELKGGSVTVTDGVDTETIQLERTEETNDENKFGVGIGAGFEIPAGSSLSIVIQGVYNIIFVSKSTETLPSGTSVETGGNISFIGVTLGLVF